MKPASTSSGGFGGIEEFKDSASFNFDSLGQVAVEHISLFQDSATGMDVCLSPIYERPESTHP